MAKRFFYVSASIFLLVLSYHLGARSAQAQMGSIDAGAFAWVQGLPAQWRFSAVEGRYFHAMEPTGRRYDPSEPIPGTARVIATDPAGFSVMLENGDVFQYNGAGWTAAGNLLDGPTKAQPQTLGGLKAKYR